MRAHARCGGSSAARCAGFAEAAYATPLSLVSGIAHAGGALYVATLVDVVRIDLATLAMRVVTRSADFATLPNFDNITSHGGALYVAIYDHTSVAAWQAHVVLTTPAHWNATGTVFDGEPDARSAADG